MSSENSMVAAKPKITIDSKASVVRDVTIEGEVTIRAGTVVHPRAVIRALKGPIVIGENNIIEETTLIENDHEEGFTMKIGNENVFEVGAVVRARSVGNHNVFQARSEVGPHTEVPDGCSIGVKCQIMKKGRLEDRFVVFGDLNTKRIAQENPQQQTRQLDQLRNTFPRYHHSYVM